MGKTVGIFERILEARHITPDSRASFLSPNYDNRHDPFLLPDMRAAVDRLKHARKKQEKVMIYGDYDIDGLTATTVLLEALRAFGFENVDSYIPNRFVEGYGLTVDAVEKIAKTGAQLVITVDCGSLSHAEITRANELGMGMIVTDHHNVADVQPPAVAVINPKRLLHDYPDRYKNYVLQEADVTFADVATPSPDVSPEPTSRLVELAALRQPPAGEVISGSPSGRRRESAKVTSASAKLYPFIDLAGVGVAFKLVQALQMELDGLPMGQEKWLLDLVALGTVCDVVSLIDENRTFVYWGLKVLAKMRRPGLRALMTVAGVEPQKVNARSLGFALGPRMNAAGRLETAQYALDMLMTRDGVLALEKAQQLDDLNKARRAEQDKIFKEAIVQAEEYKKDNVLVVSAPGWNHGIIGIVAAKLLEKYKKPTYVLEEMGEESKGSARSYGDFSAADAIRFSDDIITKGGGHKLAAGVTLPTKNIDAFRQRVNDFYVSQKLKNQADLLLSRADVTAALSELTEDLVTLIAQLEPFGNANPQPVFMTNNARVVGKRTMGAEGQHLKLELQDGDTRLQFLAFNAPAHFFVEPGQTVTVWYTIDINEWQGRRSVEGQLLHLDILSYN